MLLDRSGQCNRIEVVVCLFLVLATIAVFGQLGNHDFVNYDDPEYVTQNSNVLAGLTWEGIIWAFTSNHANNWHPLTWLSHMLDCQVFGLNAGGHHLTSLLFHVINTLLIFVVFKRMTGALWPSAFVAALFALHPLHVESVAWVAERKDVLSTFFWMMTMCAYVFYVERPGVSRYMLLLLLFALGLMAKPMLVSLPFVLLLMDYWPLGRIKCKQSTYAGKLQTNKALNPDYQRSVARLVLEKVPFFVLATVSSIVTFLVQQAGGAVKSLDVFPVQIRLANALVSYVLYVWKFVLPLNLAVFYPHPGMRPIWQVVACLMLLLGVSVLMIRHRSRHPYLATGWLWYIGTLVPVIGVVQVGAQSMADRYTYVPLIGLFIIISWGAADLTARWGYRRLGLTASAGALLLALAIGTWLQVGHWKKSVTLWKHTTNVTDNNYSAHGLLGAALIEQGNIDEGINHYLEAVRIKPDYTDAYNNVGLALASQGKIDEAISHYDMAVQIRPDDANARNNLGIALTEQGKLKEAIAHFREAIRTRPGFADFHYNLGTALSLEGKLEDAIAHFREALRIRPDDPEAYNSLGVALARKGDTEEAVVHFRKALCARPDFAEAYSNLRIAVARHTKPK